MYYGVEKKYLDSEDIKREWMCFGQPCTSFFRNTYIYVLFYCERTNNGQKSDDPILERGGMGKIEKRWIFAKTWLFLILRMKYQKNWWNFPIFSLNSAFGNQYFPIIDQYLYLKWLSYLFSIQNGFMHIFIMHVAKCV